VAQRYEARACYAQGPLLISGYYGSRGSYIEQKMTGKKKNEN